MDTPKPSLLGRLKAWLLSPLFLRLTLAFALVTVLSMVVSGFLIRTRFLGEFDRYIRARSDSDLGARLIAFYSIHQNWNGVDSVFATPVPPPDRRPHFTYTVIDSANNDVVYGAAPYMVGQPVQGDVIKDATPIEVNGKVVGWFLVGASAPAPVGPTPETEFADRVNSAVIFTLLIAIGFAVVIGAFSARALSRPIQELTGAARRIARGDLGYQVNIRSRDEIGELARAFNQMSTDLAQAINLRRQMTADIAHELRSPLSVILGYAEALSEGKLKGSSEVFESLHMEARQLQRLIDDLRTLSLADAGELPLTLAAASPVLLLERARLAFTAHAERRKVSLSASAPDDLPEIQVDADRLAQVLGNLIANALRYTPEGGQIALTAAKVGEDVELRVSDTGPGIPEKDLPHIFDRFYRSDKSRYTEEGESGLGLAIAKSIVEAHHGAISVESSPGQGAAFIIRLPLNQAA